jgi:hypothetical protein
MITAEAKRRTSSRRRRLARRVHRQAVHRATLEEKLTKIFEKYGM